MTIGIYFAITFILEKDLAAEVEALQKELAHYQVKTYFVQLHFPITPQMVVLKKVSWESLNS